MSDDTAFWIMVRMALIQMTKAIEKYKLCKDAHAAPQIAPAPQTEKALENAVAAPNVTTPPIDNAPQNI